MEMDATHLQHLGVAPHYANRVAAAFRREVDISRRAARVSNSKILGPQT
jgi:hypothetical protein